MKLTRPLCAHKEDAESCCCTGNASACFGEEDAAVLLHEKYYQKFHGRCSRGSDTTIEVRRRGTARLGAARRDLPGCPYALVYTSVMMVYGRWRRRPRSGRVGHAVNRRTRPRQNLLYMAERRRDGRIASRWLPRSLAGRCARAR